MFSECPEQARTSWVAPIRQAYVQITLTLMNLPLEIRLNIYKYMIDLPRSDHIEFLCTCEQAYREARASLFTRPLICTSQRHLEAFASHFSTLLLENVVCLQLTLEQLDYDTVRSYLDQVVMGQPVRHDNHPYTLASSKIISALHKLPNIRHLCILRSTDSTTNPLPHKFTYPILQAVKNQYTRLRSLIIEFEDISLTFLSGFPNLCSLQFSGFSRTSPEQTAQILGRLTSLRELKVVGPPRSVLWRQHSNHESEIVQSINHNTLSAIHSLESITFSEACDPNSQQPKLFLTAKMIRSLFEQHEKRLETLAISCLTLPDKPVLAYLSVFLKNANIKHLGLGWPAFDIKFLDCLPPTLQSLDVAVISHSDAWETLQRIKGIHHRLQNLRSIKFNIISMPRTAQVSQEYENTMNFALPLQHIAKQFESPWKITWSIWQPACQHLWLNHSDA